MRFLPSPSDFAFLAGGVSFLFSAFLFPGVTGASSKAGVFNFFEPADMSKGQNVLTLQY